MFMLVYMCIAILGSCYGVYGEFVVRLNSQP